MSKARDVANLFSDGGDLVDGTIDVTELGNSGTGDLAAGNFNVSGNITAAGKLQASPSSGTSVEITSGNGIAFTNSSTATIYGQSTLTLDPSPWADAGGTVNVNGSLVVEGDLTVNGTNTTINSTTKEIADLAIVVASGATNQNEANGAGITINGADVDFHWLSSAMQMRRQHPTYGVVGVNLSLATKGTRANQVSQGYLQYSNLIDTDGMYTINDVGDATSGNIQKREFNAPYGGLASGGGDGGDLWFNAYDSTDNSYYSFLRVRGNGPAGTNRSDFDYPTVEFRTPSDGVDNNYGDGNTATFDGSPVIVYSHHNARDSGEGLYTATPFFEVLAPTIRSNYRLAYTTSTHQNPGPLFHGCPMERMRFDAVDGFNNIDIFLDDAQIYDTSASSLTANFNLRIKTTNTLSLSHMSTGVNALRSYSDDKMGGTSADRSLTFVVMVKNGISNAYKLGTLTLGETNAVDITSNILWQGGSQPNGNLNSIDIYTVTLMPPNPRTSSFADTRALVSVAQFG